MGDLSGQTIRGYQLRELIGVGGVGAVYRAHQPSVGREVAIKVILSELGFIHSIVHFRPAELPVFPAFVRARAIIAMSPPYRKAGKSKSRLQKGQFSPEFRTLVSLQMDKV